MSARLAKILIAYHQLWLLLALLLGIVSLPLASRLKLDWRVEQMFPAGDPLVASYARLQERFGGNQIVLAVYRDPQLWDATGAGLTRLEEISGKLAAVDGVNSVLSLAELHAILEKLRGPIQLLGFGGQRKPPLLDEDDELAQAMLHVFEGYTHRPDSQYTSIACMLAADPARQAPAGTAMSGVDAQAGSPNLETTLAALHSVMNELPRPASDGFITGEPVLVSEGFRMVNRDGWRLGVVSSILVSLVLLVCFRSLRWTLIPLVIVHWSLIATRAVLVLLGLDLTMISSTLTAIVTVIGVATSIHLLLKFQQGRRRGSTRAEALEDSFSQLIAPITWACITDAVGFLSLTSAAVGPIRDFGLMMAVGSMMVLVAIVLLVPGLALLGRWDTDPHTPQLDLLVRLWLRRLLEFCLARRRLGLFLLFGLTLFGGVGSLLMHVETDYTKNFSSNSPLVLGYEVIERELGGGGVWDIMLPVPETLGDEYFAQVVELERLLRDLQVADGRRTLSLSKVLSFADAELASRQGPFLAAIPFSARLQGMRAAMPDFSRILLTETPDSHGKQWLRIMLRSHERVGAQAKSDLVEAVQTSVSEFTSRPAWRALFASTPPLAEVAGYHVMLGKLVASILSDQWKCFLLATLGILIVMTLATRSLKLALIAIVPNALPVLLVLGTMGWLGLPINMGAAMIAAVSLGLSVDSSIHYLLHYRRALVGQPRPLKALVSAQENVGLAVLLSTAALVAGFISLATSEFIPTVVFGTLASLTMLGGLLGNLVVLPLLIAPNVARRSASD
ncbi:MAG: MMPL family transporter [Pirellulaceae bacterium]|nr:MMPL family transporter [Pirellulaceae bacterium]